MAQTVTLQASSQNDHRSKSGLVTSCLSTVLSNNSGIAFKKTCLVSFFLRSCRLAVGPGLAPGGSRQTALSDQPSLTPHGPGIGYHLPPGRVEGLLRWRVVTRVLGLALGRRRVVPSGTPKGSGRLVVGGV